MNIKKGRNSRALSQNPRRENTKTPMIKMFPCRYKKEYKFDNFMSPWVVYGLPIPLYFLLVATMARASIQNTSPLTAPFQPLSGGLLYLFEKKKYFPSGDI